MALLSSDFLAKLDGLQLGMRKVLSGRFRGERRSRRKGQSVEFADHREYAFGDDIRFVDWHLLGRLDRLFLKLYHDEEELRVHLLVDTSRSMGFGEPTKLDHARRVAAALAYVSLSSGNRVKIVLLSSREPKELPWQRGVPTAGRVFAFLESAAPSGPNALAAGIRRWLGESRPRGLVVLLSDLLDRADPLEFLRPLVRPMLDAWLIQVLAPEEVDPDMVGEFRLLDSELEDAVDVTANARVLAAYRANLSRYIAAIETYARSRGVGHHLATTDVPFEDLVLRHLREEGILR